MPGGALEGMTETKHGSMGCVAVCCSVLLCVAVFGSVLQCLRVCSVLKCIVKYCSVWQSLLGNALEGKTKTTHAGLECVAVFCSVL